MTGWSRAPIVSSSGVGGQLGPNVNMMGSVRNLAPSNFRCQLCKNSGHTKHQCPEAGLIPKMDIYHKFPAGIPKTQLRPAKPGDKFAMLGPDGWVIPQIEQKVALIKKKVHFLIDHFVIYRWLSN
jgi:hypothetical protein